MFSSLDKEDKNKHLNKTLVCEEKGIQLFHIFENEWLDIAKKDIWISILKEKQGLNTYIKLNKCYIAYPNKEETKLFLNENHLEGSCNSNISIGLYYDNELVSIMTFSGSLDYKLNRVCTKKEYSIIGSTLMLLNTFETKYKPKSLVTTLDRRFSNNDLYTSIGFSFIEDTKPNHFYFKPGENILENFDTDMFNEGYRRIWDCGNKVYSKVY